MLDINRTFTEAIGTFYDRPYNLEALAPWSKSIAIELAEKEGISLTTAHWEVVEALRHHYRENGPSSSGRSLLHCMEVEFADLGGKKYLFDLFPRGPVNQACRISGLPVPPHSVDRSFGSAM